MKRMISNRFIPFVAITALALLLVACKGKSNGDPLPPAGATLSPTVSTRALLDFAEQRYLAGMGVELNGLIRAQPWFQQPTQAHIDLIGAIRATEKASQARGEEKSVRAMLEFSAEQAWYADGLDEREATGLKGAFDAYAESLSDRNAPTIGPELASMLLHGLFEVVHLPEGRRMILLVSAQDPEVGRKVIGMSVEALPRIEALVGAYPYGFLHISVTELPEIFAGVSYDEFIGLAPQYTDDKTVIHELTHSTLYGKFPTWFEEGFAHFVEYYLTDSVAEGEAEFRGALRQIARYGIDARLNIGPRPGYSDIDYLAERWQGFLFMKGIVDTNGIEFFTAIIRQLRTQTKGDQELIRAFAQFGSDEQKTKTAAYLCENVIGTTGNYCAGSPWR